MIRRRDRVFFLPIRTELATFPEMMLRTVLFLLFIVLPVSATAQMNAPPVAEGWDGERALELVRRAQSRRAVALEDTAMENYSADARAYVYFYLDREDTGDRNLIKTDQVALEVFWQAPDEVKQRIIGWRDERSLPTRIHYHIDHLSVVQENFGDEIQIGDGDEVRGVPHPAAPRSEAFYQFQLIDSLTLRLPGTTEPVQVYQVQTRPRDASLPGIIGSVFIDRRSGDLVRMDFTFTASSYVDPYLDYINISLDNGLWRGRFWLPNEQRVELRRRLPMLDVPAGTIIRANMRVSNYQFNQPLHPATFIGPAIVAVPRSQREEFQFEREIFDELREQGLGPAMELGEIRRMATELAQRRALQRASAARLSAGSLSDVIRYNRTEGLALGFGGAVTPHPGLRLRGQGGYAFTAGHPFGSLALSVGEGRSQLDARVYGNQPNDLALTPAASGFGNTLASVFGGRDYTDLHFADGIALSLHRQIAPQLSGSVTVLREGQRMPDTQVAAGPLGHDFRPVLPVDEGSLWGGELSLRRTVPQGLSRWTAAEFHLDGGSFQRTCADSCPEGQRFGRGQAAVTTGWRWGLASSELAMGGRGGVARGDLPLQQRFHLGGRGTVPGYRFRSSAGSRYLLTNATASAEIHPTWLRARGHAGVGWIQPGGSGVVLPTIGIGLGILHDILHVDLHRGLGTGGRWEMTVEANRDFWDFL
jgi:hypothetical protein